MPWCGPSALTPLEEFARSLPALGAAEEALPMEFPMYTVPEMQMTQIYSHEELLAQDLLVEFNENMSKAVFVTHQWLGSDRPDPEFQQMKIFQAEADTCERPGRSAGAWRESLAYISTPL